MGFNRLADAAIDSRNPRTAMREIPTGVITRGEAVSFVAFSALLFIFSSAMLSQICFWLSFPVLGFLFLYSYTKRFTWFSHIILGLAISLVPMAVWVAVTGAISFRIVLLSLALLCYISGFDVLYACQDADFDRREGLYSIPAIFGIDKALNIASLLHIISILCLISLYRAFSLSPVYLVFVGIIAFLFVIEHRLVRPTEIKEINISFYYVNSIISVLVFVATLSGALLRNIS
ncbi:MAG: UbiA family prenyltransferase [Deltaproteobacteria bacterium]|nr:UbiA family prenyltransferase [Deltaproteobacteria bacterium]